MKRSINLLIAAVLLLTMAGCGHTEASLSEPPATEPVTSMPNTTEKPATLNVSDLNSIIAALDPSGAVLHYYGETEDCRPADSAIRAAKYIERLRSFTWESYQPPQKRVGGAGYRYEFVGSGVTLTAYQDGYYEFRPLHVAAGGREGWFVLPLIRDVQVSYMLYDTFDGWYAEASAAELYRGSGTPLTADELDLLQDYTASVRSRYDEKGGRHTSATTVSCFFTSQYSDPRDMEAGAFLAYCPEQEGAAHVDEEEFQLIQTKLDWRGGQDNHLLTLSELPVPCHRLPRTYINEILMQYAGITVEDMNTDWKAKARYFPETDCFYTFTSDFGPGTFTPCYGEKAGDIVTLWSAPGGQTVLTMQKSGEGWHILSHKTAARES